jgi:hypothetical protein
MPEFSNPPVRNKRHSTEFLIGQHSLFVAGLGLAFVYLHLLKPMLPVWVAGPFFLLPWSVVFILFYHERPLFAASLIRRWWLGAVAGCAFFTVLAEVVHRLVADIFVQAMMNCGWLSLIPIVRDYRNHPELWS